jgi:putative ABC transport system permease protein
VIEVPFEQSPWRAALVTVQTSGEPAAVQQDLAAVLHGMDPELPIANPKTMEVIVGERMAADRFYTLLLGAFAALALVLAAVGIYGVMSFVVSQRTHEIGLRMALGARRQDVLGLIVREGMSTALAGAVLGTAGAWAVARAMQSLLYGGGGRAPVAYAAVAAVLLGAALVACLVPARRAASVDPMVALRQE